MNTIALKEARFFAYHGYYPEEQKTGSFFLVDIIAEVDFFKASASGDIAETLNYEQLYRIASEEMKITAKLLEQVVERIQLRIRQEYPAVKSLRIRLSKLNPALGGQVGRTYVELCS